MSISSWSTCCYVCEVGCNIIRLWNQYWCKSNENNPMYICSSLESLFKVICCNITNIPFVFHPFLASFLYQAWILMVWQQNYLWKFKGHFSAVIFGLSVECYVQYEGLYHFRTPDLTQSNYFCLSTSFSVLFRGAQVNTACETCFFALILSILSGYKSGLPPSPSAKHEFDMRGTTTLPPICV